MSKRNSVRARRSNFKTYLLVTGSALVVGAVPGAALAQQTSDGSGTEVDELVITGFRKSLSEARDIKRDSVIQMDVIVAEDMAKFPDLNLAESLQRLPGVQINREAGEGRRISLRGLGPDFARVQLNGMEVLGNVDSAQDSRGQRSRDRAFDFNIFASELFNNIRVRKTQAAMIEEGSLGATIDLQTTRPFDYNGFRAAASVQYGYNDLSESWNPRFAGLISNTFADGRFGALLSVAYSERDTVEEGTGTVRWSSATANGGFNPASPFAEALAADVYAPRFPRYTLMEHDQKRTGVTGALQFKPGDNTLVTLEAL